MAKKSIGYLSEIAKAPKFLWVMLFLFVASFWWLDNVSRCMLNLKEAGNGDYIQTFWECSI